MFLSLISSFLKLFFISARFQNSFSINPDGGTLRRRLCVPLFLCVMMAIPSGLVRAESVSDTSDVSVLVHYWNFNEIPNNTNFSLRSPELLNASSRLYGAFLSYEGARWDRVNDPTPLNARENPYVEEDDRALRLRNPAGPFTLHLPTEGYRDVVVRYAIKRTSNGAHGQAISFSTDGETFVTDTLVQSFVAVDEFDYTLVELDFSGIEGTENNRDFKVRLSMVGEGSEPDNDDGNQRINHVSLDGIPLAPDPEKHLIHHWDFNNIPNDVDFPTRVSISAGGITGGESIVTGSWIRYDGERWDRVNDATPFNARAVPYDEEEDRAMRMRNPTGDITLRLPTSGYRDVVVSYVVRRTDNGATGQQVAYSTDGMFFSTSGLRHSSIQVGLNYVQHVVDFSTIPDVNNNPDFTLRITPSGTGAEPDNFDGNQRFNHITVDARPTETSATDPVARPFRLELEQNYPNPFNPSTQIRFTVPEYDQVSLSVYDVAGRHIETLIDRPLAAGSHSVTFDARNLSSGIYFYRLQTSQQMLVRPMTLIR